MGKHDKLPRAAREKKSDARKRVAHGQKELYFQSDPLGNETRMATIWWSVVNGHRKGVCLENGKKI